MSEFNIKEVKVHRTLEGTIFEIAFAAITTLLFTDIALFTILIRKAK